MSIAANDILKKSNALLQKEIDDLKIMMRSVADNNTSSSVADNITAADTSLEQNALTHLAVVRSSDTAHRPHHPMQILLLPMQTATL